METILPILSFLWNFLKDIRSVLCCKSPIKIKAEIVRRIVAFIIIGGPPPETYLSLAIKITNLGQRPITITSVIIEYKKTNKHIETPRKTFDRKPFPKKLDYTDTYTYHVPLIKSNFESIKRIIVVDSSEKQWKIKGTKIQRAY